MPFCPHCGNRVEDGDRFCASCGTPQETAAPAAAPDQELSAAPQGAYTPPRMPEYPQGQPPVPSREAVPEKKKGSAVKWIVIGGIALALVALTILIVRLIGAAVGGGTDPNVGRYEAVKAELWGIEVDIEDVYPDGFVVELRGGGACGIIVGAREFNGKWELDADDNEFHIESRGLDCEGTLADGVLVMEDVMDSGVNLTFLREGAALPDGAPAQDPAAFTGDAGGEARAYLTGDWYGWWQISEQTGSYEEWTGNWWDCCASFEPLDNGNLLLTLWDEDYPKEDPVARVEMTVTAPGGGQPFRAVSVEGTFWNTRVEPDDYEITPDAEGYDHLIAFSGTNRDDKGSFAYVVCLRPWGQDWSDIAQDDPDDMPYYYDWYWAQVQSGVTRAPTQKLMDVLE